MNRSWVRFPQAAPIRPPGSGWAVLYARVVLRCCSWSHGCCGRRRARPPARLGSLTSFGAAPRSPPVPSGPSGALHAGGAVLLCVAERVVSKHGHAPPPPTGAAAWPSGALHTGAAGLLVSGSACSDRRLGRSSWSGLERNIAPVDRSSAWRASAVKEISPLLS